MTTRAMSNAFRSPRDRCQTGFTLIELMITVAIIGMLAAIAYPAYTDSVLKGRRAEGRAALLDLMQQQERYLTQTGSYLKFAQAATGSAGTNKDSTTVTIPFKTKSGDGSSPAYELKADTCSGGAAATLSGCVLLTAVPVRADTQFGNLTLTSTGQKSCSTGNPKCW